MNIKQANLNDVLDVARLALVLWPHHSMHAMALKISETIQENKGAYFLALDKNETIGFAQVNLRHDYVEGTHSNPVGYLEGIFVVENYRQQGGAKQLLAACEKWAREQGCEELASDCELSSEENLNFHRCVGFEEANRIICFTKPLKGESY